MNWALTSGIGTVWNSSTQTVHCVCIDQNIWRNESWVCTVWFDILVVVFVGHAFMCSLPHVEKYWYFRGAYCYHWQCRWFELCHYNKDSRVFWRISVLLPDCPVLHTRRQLSSLLHCLKCLLCQCHCMVISRKDLWMKDFKISFIMLPEAHQDKFVPMLN